MSRLRIKITGAALQNVAGLHQRISADQLEAAATAGALVFQNAAKQKVRYKTGNLRRSIHTETLEKSASRVRVAVGTNVVYARIHEYGGTVKPSKKYLVFMGQDGKKVFTTKTITITAQPYLRPAFDENKAEAQRVVGEAIKRMLGI